MTNVISELGVVVALMKISIKILKEFDDQGSLRAGRCGGIDENSGGDI